MNMKKNIFIIALITNNMVGYSQQAIPEALVYCDSVPYFYAYGGHVLKTLLSSPKGKTYVLIDDIVIDTIMERSGRFGRNISSSDKTRKDIIYYGGDYYYKLSVETGKLDTINSISYGGRYDVVWENQLIGHVGATDTIISSFIITYDILNKYQKCSL
jgi:hypothetical protein